MTTNRPNCEHRGRRVGWHRPADGPRIPRYVCRSADVDAETCLPHLPRAAAAAGDPSLPRPRTSWHSTPACDTCPHYREPTPTAPRRPAAATAGPYLGLDDLARDALLLAERLPANTSAIIGMPRSGMIPAATIAAHLHRPLYHWTAEGPRPTGAGDRGSSLYRPDGPAVLIDDSIFTGRTLALARRQLDRPAAEWPNVLTAAIYAHPNHAEAPDLIAQVIDPPHLFEWNLWNSEQLVRYATDLDGILCRDIDPADDDDGPRYHHALLHARPLHVPRRVKPRAIITARPEAYRPHTAAWLDAHGACWHRLDMAPERMRDADKIARYKAERIADAGAALYIESDPTLARLIHHAAAVPVLCPAAKTLWGQLP